LNRINLYSKKDYVYYVFCSRKDLKTYKNDNIKIVDDIKGKKWLDRIKWDSYGLKNWSRKQNIKADLVISLQNTGVRYFKDIPQLVYIHQSLPFSNAKWNVWKKEERILWFYKNVYKYFIQYNLSKDTFIVVQTNTMKEMIIKQFHWKWDRIKAINPSFENIDINRIQPINFKDNKFHIFYPASTVLYKNHELIIKALKYIKDNKPEIYQNLLVHFTFKENSTRNKQLANLMKTLKVRDRIVLEDSLPYEKVLSFYKSCNLVVFSSYVETFGLPLIEVASFGLPLLVSDLPFSREVIGGYRGARFLNFKDFKQWGEAIIDIYQKRPKFKSFKPQRANSWKQFFDLVDKFTNN
jgi:glycosyltransferase involved in cell wall biosynthesis